MLHSSRNQNAYRPIKTVVQSDSLISFKVKDFFTLNSFDCTYFKVHFCKMHLNTSMGISQTIYWLYGPFPIFTLTWKCLPLLSTRHELFNGIGSAWWCKLRWPITLNICPVMFFLIDSLDLIWIGLDSTRTQTQFHQTKILQ